MTKLSTEQIQSISKFRASHPQCTLLNDEAVISVMIKEMIEKGVVYEGFEALVQTPAKSDKPVSGGGHLYSSGTMISQMTTSCT